MRHLDRLMLIDLEKIYDEHANAIYAFLLNVTRNQQDTNDIMQEVFVRLCTKPSLLENISNLRSWLIKMAHRIAIDFIRRSQFRERTHVSATKELLLFDSPHDAKEEDFQIHVSAAMAELPEEQRAVVHLKIWEEMTFAQIADTLNISQNTAASRYRYALEKLKSHLQNQHELMPL